jgi:hypothetical protein
MRSPRDGRCWAHRSDHNDRPIAPDGEVQKVRGLFQRVCPVRHDDAGRIEMFAKDRINPVR